MDILRIKDASGNWRSIPGIGPESLIPAPPTQDGTYTLVVSLDNGSVEYDWVLSDATIPTLSSTATDIKMDGTQSAGTSSKAARADHVHPKDTSKVLYFKNCHIPETTENLLVLGSNKITADHIVSSIEWANPSAITTDVEWTTGNGYLSMSGTCAKETTVDIVLIKKDN